MITFDVTIPVLNEEKTLDRQVKILYAFLKLHFPTPNQWRIVIADNGSTDDTQKIGAALASQIAEVQLLRVPSKGVGLALKTSWAQSDADIVGYMDLDLATDLTHFLETMKALTEQNQDFVYTTRLHARSRVIGRTLKREVTSRIFNMMLKLYLGVRFSDGMCGFKFLWRKHVPMLQAGGAISDGWFFSTELLTVAEWRNLKLYELPVTWNDDSDSRVNIPGLAKQYMKAMKVLKTKKM